MTANTLTPEERSVRTRSAHIKRKFKEEHGREPSDEEFAEAYLNKYGTVHPDVEAARKVAAEVAAKAAAKKKEAPVAEVEVLDPINPTFAGLDEPEPTPEEGEISPEKETPEAVEEVRTVHIHFLDDGFTLFGQVWYRGQELKLRTDDPKYKETLDPETKRSCIEYNADDQFKFWGKVIYGNGPWPYVSQKTLEEMERDISTLPPDEQRRARKRLQREQGMAPPSNAPLAGRSL